MPVLLFFVDIFIGKVDATGEADVAVNDTNFAVVTVVGGSIQARVEGIKDAHLKALLPQLFAVHGRQGGDTADVVIQDAYLYAVPLPLLQHLQDAVPHFSMLHDEVFHQDELFCAAQLFEQPPIKLLAEGEVFHLGVAVDFKAGGAADISRLPTEHRVNQRQLLQGCGLRKGVVWIKRNLAVVAVQQRAGVAVDLLCHPSAVALHAKHQIEDAAHQRNRHDEDDPGNLVGRVVLPRQNPKNHQKAENIEGDADPVLPSAKLDQREQQQKQLQQDEDNEDEQTAGQ